MIALELFGNPEQCAEDYGTVVAGQLHDSGLDDEAAEFDQMPRALAALDLPCAHIMPGARRLIAVARRAVAFERRQRRAQMLSQFAALAARKTSLRVSTKPPVLRHP